MSQIRIVELASQRLNEQSHKAKGKAPMTSKTTKKHDKDVLSPSDSKGISDPNWKSKKGDEVSEAKDEEAAQQKSRHHSVPHLTRVWLTEGGDGIPDLVGAMSWEFGDTNATFRSMGANFNLRCWT